MVGRQLIAMLADHPWFQSTGWCGKRARGSNAVTRQMLAQMLSAKNALVKPASA
ncbi:MAG: hypothetical protein ACRD37_07315 [Candidatus Acidiferrales bacterium]